MPLAERQKIGDDLKKADSIRTIYPYSSDDLMYELSKKYCGIDLRR